MAIDKEIRAAIAVWAHDGVDYDIYKIRYSNYPPVESKKGNLIPRAMHEYHQAVGHRIRWAYEQLKKNGELFSEIQHMKDEILPRYRQYKKCRSKHRHEAVRHAWDVTRNHWRYAYETYIYGQCDDAPDKFSKEVARKMANPKPRKKPAPKGRIRNIERRIGDLAGTRTINADQYRQFQRSRVSRPRIVQAQPLFTQSDQVQVFELPEAPGEQYMDDEWYEY